MEAEHSEPSSAPSVPRWWSHPLPTLHTFASTHPTSHPDTIKHTGFCGGLWGTVRHVSVPLSRQPIWGGRYKTRTQADKTARPSEGYREQWQRPSEQGGQKASLRRFQGRDERRITHHGGVGGAGTGVHRRIPRTFLDRSPEEKPSQECHEKPGMEDEPTGLVLEGLNRGVGTRGGAEGGERSSQERGVNGSPRNVGKDASLLAGCPREAKQKSAGGGAGAGYGRKDLRAERGVHRGIWSCIISVGPHIKAFSFLFWTNFGSTSQIGTHLNQSRDTTHRFRARDLPKNSLFTVTFSII